MIVLGAISWLALRLGDGKTSGLIGLLAGTAAAPGLLVAGVPFADDENYPMAVLASIPLWLLLGFVASRRATRSPMASWRHYWFELMWLAVAVVLGAAVALAAATALLGESLLL